MKKNFNLKKIIIVAFSAISGTMIITIIGVIFLLQRAVHRHDQQYTKIVEELDTFTEVSQFAKWSKENELPVILQNGERVTDETEELDIIGYDVNVDFSISLEARNCMGN